MKKATLLLLGVIGAAFLLAGCSGTKEVSAEDASNFGGLPSTKAKH